MKKITLIIGGELLLNLEALDFYRQKALQGGYGNRLRYYAEDVSGTAIEQQIQTFGLFGEKKLLEIHLTDEKKLDKKIQNWLNNPPNSHDTVLIIFAPDLEKPEQSAWFKKISNEVEISNNKKLYGNQIEKELQKRLQINGLKMSPNAFYLFQQSCDNNLLAGQQTINQLKIYQQENIDEALLNQVLIQQGQYNPFMLSESILTGKYQQALNICQQMTESLNESEKKQFQMVLTAQLSKDFNLLLSLYFNTAPNDFAELFKQYGILNFKQQIYHQGKNIYGLNQVKLGLRLVNKLDKINKGGMVGDYWQTLTAFLLYRLKK